MDRLSTLDAEFLHMEDELAHMHIAGLCLFDGPAPTLGELRALLASKLHLIPRYRQRIRTVPLELGRPVWVDDADFDLDAHVTTADPPTTDEAGLRQLMGDLMGVPLDRSRPLWGAWLVDGLDDGRWGLVFKVHHCMVDGVAGVELLEVLLDLTDDTAVGDPQPWDPRPEPADAALVVDAWLGLAADALDWASKIPTMAASPGDALKTVADTGAGLWRFIRNLNVTPKLSIDGNITAGRTWASSSADLSDVRTIRDVYGGTINDVVLAAVSGGYRALLTSRGEDPDTAVVRSMVPVSLRSGDGHGVADNRVSTLLYELPIGIADPVDRLRTVHEEMADLKGSHMAEAGEVVTSLGNLAPPMLVGPITRLAIRGEHLLPQRFIDTVTTNVPGPQFPLYCLGREMTEYRPFVPISHGVRVGTAILSYNGRLFFGITGDAATATDVAVVADASAAAVAELARAARPTHPPRHTRSGATAKSADAPTAGSGATKRSGTSRKGSAATKRSGTSPKGSAATKRSGTSPKGSAATKRSGTSPKGGGATKRSGSTSTD